jgi:2,4-dienoyl-CoA reductase-like NADH-dependent reductase (Old Yellow Enzyme family)
VLFSSTGLFLGNVPNLPNQFRFSVMTQNLSTQLVLPNGATVPNRIAKAAMTEGLSDARAYPTEALNRLYALWAQSGCGVLITGNVQIDRDHLERPGNVVIDQVPDAEMRAALASWARVAKSGGAKLWMQISHGGRQTPATVNKTPDAPSAVPLDLPGKNFGKPVAMTEAAIREVISRFAIAASAAQAAGFDGVQIHSAHGYLLSSFLSPRANVRTDQWGGSLENRARLLLEVVRAVRAATGADFTITVKLNSADFQKGGFGFSDSLQVVKWLEAEKVDLIEISGGNYEQPKLMNVEGKEKPDTTGMPVSTATREAYFADFAAEMRRSVQVPLMVTGGFRSAAAMNQAIEQDGISMIGVGRPLCVDTGCVGKLLRGEISVLEKSEDRLVLGPGWLGKNSPFAMIKGLNAFGAIYWYYQQLRHYGRGELLDQQLGLLSALSRELKDQKNWLAAASDVPARRS